MDERKLKRLAVITLMAIVVVMIAKYMLTRTINTLNAAALEKKHAAVVQQPPGTASESAGTSEPEAVPESAALASDSASRVLPANPADSQIQPSS